MAKGKKGKKGMSRKARPQSFGSFADLGKALGVKESPTSVGDVLGTGMDPLARDRAGQVYAKPKEPQEDQVIFRRKPADAPVIEITRVTQKESDNTDSVYGGILDQKMVDAIRALRPRLEKGFRPGSYFRRNDFDKFFEDLKPGLGWVDIRSGVTSIMEKCFRRGEDATLDFIDIVYEISEVKFLKSILRGILGADNLKLHGPEIDAKDFDVLMAYAMGEHQLPEPQAYAQMSLTRVGSTGRGHWDSDGYVASEGVFAYKTSKVVLAYSSREDEEVMAFINWYKTQLLFMKKASARAWALLDFWGEVKKYCKGQKEWRSPVPDLVPYDEASRTGAKSYWRSCEDWEAKQSYASVLSGYDNSDQWAEAWAPARRDN